MLLSFLLMAMATMAQQKATDIRTIEVVGEADIEVVPNEIYVLFSLTPYQLEGNTWVAVDTLEQQLKAAIAAEKLEDYELEILETYSVNAPWLDYDKPKNMYEQTDKEVRFYRLRFSSPSNLDAIFRAIDPRGVGNIKVEKLWHSDHEQYYNQLLSQASENARTHATAILKPLASKPGDILKVAPESLVDELRDSFMERALVESYRQARVGNDDLDLTGRKLILQVRNYYTFAIVK